MFLYVCSYITRKVKTKFSVKFLSIKKHFRLNLYNKQFLQKMIISIIFHKDTNLHQPSGFCRIFEPLVHSVERSIEFCFGRIPKEFACLKK